MANERVFCKGVMAFKPNEKAPSFVKGSLVITMNDLFEWCKGDGQQHLTEYNGKKQIRLQITENKSDGKYNVSVDTFVPKKQEVSSHGTTTRNGITTKDDDLPFALIGMIVSIGMLFPF